MADTRSVELPAPRGARWPLGVSLVATVGILLITCAMILDLRREVGARARETSENLLRAVERDIARNIEVLDLSLQAVVEGVSRPDVVALDPKLRNMILFDRSATATSLGALVAFDANGVLTYDSASVLPRQIPPVSDRDYFLAQKDRDHGLYVSRPYLSRLIGQDVIGLSRRITRPDGSFGGVALATIQLKYFTDLLSRMKLGSAGAVSLMHEDGTIIVRSSAGLREALPSTTSELRPTTGPQEGGSLAGSPVFETMRRASAGTFVGTSRIDGVERAYTFTRVAELPLIVSVGLATTDIYSHWMGKALWGGLVLFGICLVVVGLTAVLTRELRRRGIAERGLVLANAELARLSRTDALTDLFNRRVFDEALAREVSRSSRTGRQMSLVIVDVDHFKRFNDRYGHAEGDRALRAVADVLRQVTCRPGDVAFRVGGEEFALLLPETGLAGAMVVAERVRLQVRLLARAHADSPAGTLTVSLGVAEARGGDSAALYASADAALYRSKRDGRDRVSASERWPAAA